ncbi:hypothetical protein NC652_040264 [Populus alba x Populus x berolinensis]|nr:hypothetical protein NC652_040264 [Populus alba x Populus x berolinensis]
MGYTLFGSTTFTVSSSHAEHVTSLLQISGASNSFLLVYGRNEYWVLLKVASKDVGFFIIRPSPEQHHPQDVLMGLLFVEVILGAWTSWSGMVQQCLHELKMDFIQA